MDMNEKLQQQLNNNAGTPAATPAQGGSIMDKINNAFNQATASAFEALPAGQYLVKVDKVEMKETKDGAPYISAVYKVLDGPQTNRLEFHNVYLVKKSGDVNDVSINMFKALMKATGVNTDQAFQNTLMDYQGKQFTIVMKDKTSKDGQYVNRNYTVA